MGWSRGSSLLEEVAMVIRSNVADFADRVEIYRNLIPLFEDLDAEVSDVYGSCDEAFDKAYEELFPEETDYDNEYDEE